MIPYLVSFENDNITDQDVIYKSLKTGHLYCLFISVDPAAKKLGRKTIKVWPMMPRKQTNAGEEVLAVQMFSLVLLLISYIV